MESRSVSVFTHYVALCLYQTARKGPLQAQALGGQAKPRPIYNPDLTYNHSGQQSEARLEKCKWSVIGFKYLNVKCKMN